MEHPGDREPAPALRRGLELLRRLNREGAASLEQLAGGTGWPKSSVARLLESLERAGAAARDPATKRYHARVRLTPVGSVNERLRGVWSRVSDQLADAAGHTAELHRFDGQRLTMIDRCEPEHALVTARARIGFTRDFAEVDALTQLVFAFGLTEEHRPDGPHWAWQQAERAPLTPAQVRQTVARARETAFACDLGVNEHGVFRYATPLRDNDDRLVAVIALAQVCSPSSSAPDPQLQRLVRDAADRIEQMLNSSLSPM